MRIKSGGPTSTQSAQQAQRTSAASKSQGARFAGMVDKTGSSTDQPSQGKSQMMQALAELAADLEAGKATKEEASRRFVGLVIEERFGKQQGKGAKNMGEVVGQMVEDDPQFVARLQSQLKRLSRG
ncbi:MAG: hypothetical protein FJ137_14430 [Deltaproteobacteria bacterium]|nr:hypothetical protein [Deltaproteobacteria bacterium]